MYNGPSNFCLADKVRRLSRIIGNYKLKHPTGRGFDVEKIKSTAVVNGTSSLLKIAPVVCCIFFTSWSNCCIVIIMYIYISTTNEIHINIFTKLKHLRL